MEDLLSETEALGRLLEDHRGGEVRILDLRGMSGWTDFFVIATAASDAHMDGMERHLKDFCRERDIPILRKSTRPKAGLGTGLGPGDQWRIIDLGHAVIHLMTAKSREFYDLERLYA